MAFGVKEFLAADAAARKVHVPIDEETAPAPVEPAPSAPSGLGRRFGTGASGSPAPVGPAVAPAPEPTLAPTARKFGTRFNTSAPAEAVTRTPVEAPRQEDAPVHGMRASEPAPMAPSAPPASERRRFGDGTSAPLPRPGQEQPPVSNSPRPTGYVGRMISPHTPSRPGMTLRLERLIEEVGLHRKWSRDKIEQTKNRAAERPKDAEAAYLKVYTEEVRPSRGQAARSVQEAMNANPNALVFVVQRGGEHQFEVIDRPASPEVAPQALLHGAVLQSLPALSTPFPAPAQLFPVAVDVVAEPAAPEPETALEDSVRPAIEADAFGEAFAAPEGQAEPTAEPAALTGLRARRSRQPS